MRSIHTIFVSISVALFIAPADAQIADVRNQGWQIYFDKESGTRVEYPATLFSVDAGAPERGVGRVFESRDGRAKFSAYALEIENNDTPRRYLDKFLKVDPGTIDYQRVTGRFFVVSGIRDGEVYYSRCNFSAKMHCIYLSYPASDLRAWDGIVRRVSFSLRGRNL